MFYY
ncbi:hypothetical protein CP8484711_0011A, partial [Chlamydia psittaci 84-8471/1]